MILLIKPANKARNEMFFTLRIARNFYPLSQCVFAHVRTKQIFEVNIASYDVARSGNFAILFMLH